jgi:glutathione S-transferase
MLTVHHLGISQSDRIVWLCEELKVPYEMVKYDRAPNGLAPPEYKALHPAGTAPVITDGDLVLGESGAIIEYIIGKYGAGQLAVTADKPNFADYLFWFHFANASMLPRSMIVLIMRMVGGDGGDERAGALAERSDQAFDMVENRLGQAAYFAGDEFTAADIMMTFGLTTMRMFVPRDLAPYPNIRAYLQRIGARPAFQTAMAKADPNLPPQLT